MTRNRPAAPAPLHALRAGGRDGDPAPEASDLDRSMGRHPAGKVAERDGAPYLSVADTPTGLTRADLSVVRSTPGVPTVPMVPTMIGLSGYAQTGKDTLASILVEDYGFTLVSPSNVLREFLYAQDLYLPDERPLSRALLDAARDLARGRAPRLRRNLRLNEVVDALGWDEARARHPYIRRLQQNTGTEAGRNVLHEDVWVDALGDRLTPGGRYVSTSVRYANEAQAVLGLGGVIIRITRPGVGPVNAHDSDKSVDALPCDHVVDNDGSLEDLRVKVVALLGEPDRRAAA